MLELIDDIDLKLLHKDSVSMNLSTLVVKRVAELSELAGKPILTSQQMVVQEICASQSD